MLYDNRSPRYLPHLEQRDILAMGLSPLARSSWIETDTDWLRYHTHKIRTRERLGQRAYRTEPTSMKAQQELSSLLLEHLLKEQSGLYARENNTLVFVPHDKRLWLTTGEPLWNCSLWIADDLIIMEPRKGRYYLTAASLCSPSGWRLEETFGEPITQIHSPIPRFHDQLAGKVERFFSHLKPNHPVVRYNWSLQCGDSLCRREAETQVVDGSDALYSGSERHPLWRLPQTQAIVFTIRVYLHPLSTLSAPHLASLLDTIAAIPPPLAQYKGLDRIRERLARYVASLTPGL